MCDIIHVYQMKTNCHLIFCPRLYSRHHVPPRYALAYSLARSHLTSKYSFCPRGVSLVGLRRTMLNCRGATDVCWLRRGAICRLFLHFTCSACAVFNNKRRRYTGRSLSRFQLLQASDQYRDDDRQIAAECHCQPLSQVLT